MSTEVAGTSILITDVERRKSLPIIRSLGRAGVEVIGAAPHRLTVGGLSRYCSHTLRSPDYALDPDAFLAWLRVTCETRRPTTFLPLEDRTIELCLAHPDAWQPFTSALLPSKESMETAYDKWKTIEVAASVGVATPRSHCPTSREEAAALAADWSGPAIVKPRKTSGSRGMRLVDDPADLLSAWEEVSVEHPRPIVQELVSADGDGLGVFALLDADGHTIAVFGHKRLREYPITGGPSTLRVGHRDEALIEQSLALLRAMDFRGVAMVEYKMDLATGRPLLMEVNPRFWGSIQLAVSSGVDFPLLYHRLSAGLAVEPVLDFEPGHVGRWLLPGDLLHFLANPQRWRLEPSFFKFVVEDLSYDIVSLRDPLPMLGVVIEGLRRLRRGR